MGFQGSLVVKNPSANAGDVGLIPGLGRCSGGGHGNPLQYSCLENPMDRGAWEPTVHELTESDMTEQLSTVQFIESKIIGGERHSWACKYNMMPIRVYPKIVMTLMFKLPGSPQSTAQDSSPVSSFILWFLNQRFCFCTHYFIVPREVNIHEISKPLPWILSFLSSLCLVIFSFSSFLPLT